LLTILKIDKTVFKRIKPVFHRTPPNSSKLLQTPKILGFQLRTIVEDINGRIFEIVKQLVYKNLKIKKIYFLKENVFL
jgi:hypothetical protein